MLEAPQIAVEVQEMAPPPYQPPAPPSFAQYVAYAMANPDELWRVLGPALGPAAPAVMGMLRNMLMRPQTPNYR
jgi:hypothetical protein